MHVPSCSVVKLADPELLPAALMAVTVTRYFLKGVSEDTFNSSVSKDTTRKGMEGRPDVASVTLNWRMGIRLET